MSFEKLICFKIFEYPIEFSGVEKIYFFEKKR